MADPEREKNTNTSVPEQVEHRAERPEIPEHIEKDSGVMAIPSDFTAQITDDSGQQMVQTPQGQQIVITIPADEEDLEQMSKGNIVDAVTWFARFWLRTMKKAWHFGWKVVLRRENT